MNHFQLLVIIALLFLSHVILFILYRKSKKSEKLLSKILKTIYKMITFTVYIRLLLEAFLFLYLSSIFEVYNLNFKTAAKIISYIFSIFLLIALLMIMASVVILWIISRNDVFNIEISMFRELFEGIKEGKYPRLFQTVFLTRRMLSATWIVLSMNAIIDVRIVIFSIIQFASLVFLIIIRPFKELQENIIEIINDSVYSIV